jgi:N-acetyl-gamma-glutamyl-phosphate reductase
MNRPRIGVVGASGYSGAVAARLIAGHPGFSLAFVTSDKLAGSEARKALGPVVPAGLAFSPNAATESLAAECDAIILATPAEASAELAPKVLAAARGTRIVDLSGAFRLAGTTDYARHYGFDHPSPGLLADAWYGLPELFGPPPSGTRLVSNPGCYPTATLLALAPLVRAGLVETTGLIVDAKSGVSGAGVQAKQEYSFVEIDEDVRAYKLLAHQHTPEIERHLGRAAQIEPPRLTFTPHLVPLRRGLLATCYARPRPGTTAARVHECLAEAYASAAFVDVVAPGECTMKSVAGTNRAKVGATANGDVVIAIGVIDNLVKGAAGQAVQNLNLLFGLAETEGLDRLHPLQP